MDVFEGLTDSEKEAASLIKTDMRWRQNGLTSAARSAMMILCVND
jgi:hypothetical protein